MKRSTTRKMSKLHLLLLTIALCWASSAQAAGFDCAKAGMAVEKMICADAVLSALDDEMGPAYKKALQTNDKQAASIRQVQKQWVKQRDACTDADCMRQAYMTRLESLTAMRGGSWTYRGGKWNISDRSDPLCHTLLRRLNRYEWKEFQKPDCSWGIIATYLKFSNPPWKNIDPKIFGPKKYEDLIFKLKKYSQEGPSGYFHRLPGLKPQQPDSVYRNRAKEFTQDGGRLQVWRTKISTFNVSSTPRPDPASTRERTLIRMSYNKLTQEKRDELHSKFCKGMPKESDGWDRGQIFYVTPDLSGPDPDVDPGTFKIAASSDLKMYQGTPIFVDIYASLWRDTTYGLSGSCSFEFIRGGE